MPWSKVCFPTLQRLAHDVLVVCQGQVEPKKAHLLFAVGIEVGEEDGAAAKHFHPRCYAGKRATVVACPSTSLMVAWAEGPGKGFLSAGDRDGQNGTGERSSRTESGGIFRGGLRSAKNHLHAAARSIDGRRGIR